MPTIQESIAAWRDKKISGTALMRILVSHPAWMLPMSESAVAETLQTGAASRFQYNRDDLGLNRLLIFSDPDTFAAYCKRGGQDIEQHFLTTNGSWLFSLPLEGIDRIWIDPLNEGDIFYTKEQFEQLRGMAASLDVEAALAGLRHGTAPDDALGKVKNFPSYWVPVGIRDDTMRLMLAPDGEGRKLAAVFTSEDTLAALLPELRQAAAPEQVVARIFAGAALFQILQSMPIAGIVFNCKGPVEPIAFAKAFADVVCET